MQIIHDIEAFTKKKKPISLSIGMFDGVHTGHQAIINRLIETKGHSVILTFSSHPCEILFQKKISYLTTLSHRLALLERMGIDAVISMPFTKTFSKQSAKSFLTYLRRHIPFSHLILGHDATIGQGKQGDRSLLFPLAHFFGFTLEYIEPVQIDGITISSSEIRQHIQSGDLEATNRLLKRPYSMFTRVIPGVRKGRILGFHTANLPVEELCLPPLGVYAVKVMVQNKSHLAIANLGHAPTIHTQRPALLEVHLLNCHKEFYGEEMEVIFLKFIRPERRFPTTEALKEQIKRDISFADRFFKTVKESVNYPQHKAVGLYLTHESIHSETLHS